MLRPTTRHLNDPEVLVTFHKAIDQNPTCSNQFTICTLHNMNLFSCQPKIHLAKNVHAGSRHITLESVEKVSGCSPHGNVPTSAYPKARSSRASGDAPRTHASLSSTLRPALQRPTVRTQARLPRVCPTG